MARMVNCKKYGKELPGLAVPPYPGPKGQEIYQTVSQQAWQEWQAQQTMLINEKQLNMMNCLLYTSPSPRDRSVSRMPSSA